MSGALLFEHLATTPAGRASQFWVQGPAAPGDPVQNFVSTQGGMTVQSFARINPWLGAVSNSYNGNDIRFGTFSDSVLTATNGDLFDPRLIGTQVLLGDRSIGGNFRFRFDTEADARAFFQAFDRVDEFVETTNIGPDTPICCTRGTCIWDGRQARRIETPRASA